MRIEVSTIPEIAVIVFSVLLSMLKTKQTLCGINKYFKATSVWIKRPKLFTLNNFARK